MVREGLERAPAPHFRESSPSRRGGPRKGLAQGPARIELRRIPGDPRINPARRGGEREASRGWKGMRSKGGGAGRGPGLVSDPPPQDPLQPPLRGLEGPGRGGVVGEDCPPIPPAFSGLSGRVLGEASRGFCRPGGRKAPFRAARAAPPKPQLPHRFGPQLASQVPGEGKNPGWLAKVPGPGKKNPGGCTPTPSPPTPA
jgi:hypothetical protein